MQSIAHLQILQLFESCSRFFRETLRGGVSIFVAVGVSYTWIHVTIRFRNQIYLGQQVEFLSIAHPSKFSQIFHLAGHPPWTNC
jgi:hypothetical protein